MFINRIELLEDKAWYCHKKYVPCDVEMSHRCDMGPNSMSCILSEKSIAPFQPKVEMLSLSSFDRLIQIRKEININ
jgi:hypothetical protein